MNTDLDKSVARIMGRHVQPRLSMLAVADTVGYCSLLEEVQVISPYGRRAQSVCAAHRLIHTSPDKTYFERNHDTHPFPAHIFTRRALAVSSVSCNACQRQNRWQGGLCASILPISTWYVHAREPECAYGALLSWHACVCTQDGRPEVILGTYDQQVHVYRKRADAGGVEGVSAEDSQDPKLTTAKEGGVPSLRADCSYHRIFEAKFAHPIYGEAINQTRWLCSISVYLCTHHLVLCVLSMLLCAVYSPPFFFCTSLSFSFLPPSLFCLLFAFVHAMKTWIRQFQNSLLP